MMNLSRNASLGLLSACGAGTIGTFLFSKIRTKSYSAQSILNYLFVLLDFAYLIYYVYFDTTSRKLFDAEGLQLVYTLVFAFVLVSAALYFLFVGLKKATGNLLENSAKTVTRFMLSAMVIIFAFTRADQYDFYTPLAAVSSLVLLLEMYS